jgi:hypothetical protein
MIFQEVTPNKQMALRGWECSTPTNVINTPTPKETVKFCTCDFFCTYEEDVFADLTDEENEYKNDYKSFLLDLKSENSTFEINLVKPSGEKIPLVDNTYGVFYPMGFNEKQPLQAGFKILWLNVLKEESLGSGTYYFEIKQTDFGIENVLETQKYNLYQWDELRSNYTVKIEWNQRGKILNGLDYTGLVWGDMIRVKGRFGNIQPQYEINKLQDSNYRDINIQTEYFNQYNLETMLLPVSVGEIITGNLSLTDEIFISVNDVFAYDQYRQLPVTFEGTISTSDDYARNNMKVFNVTFKDKSSKLKRTFNT